MAIERRLTEIVGPVGGKLHTARSRNDQVATDVALFTREARAGDASSGSSADGARCSTPPRRTSTGRCPGYTHLQRAQPVYLGHHLLAYFWMLARDRERFAFAGRAGRPTLPLGAGALAGVNFDTDRAHGRARAGLRRRRARTRSTPSPTATSCSTTSRAAATCATHLSRLGAEIVLWSSEEFGFVELVRRLGVAARRSCRRRRTRTPPSCCARKAPRVVGHLAALHGVMHGLPLTYNKDMQEDKEHLFDAVDTLALCLAAADGHARAARASTRAPGGARPPTSCIAATDIADLLVRRGVPFREAHGIVAGLVRDGRRQRPRAVGAARRRSSPRTRERSTTSSRECCSARRGWSRRSPRAARRSRACASSSRWPARSSRLMAAGAATPALLRPARCSRSPAT